MDGTFLDAVDSLRGPAAGTESRAWLLYGLVRMTRPARLLEVGMGYTTPFLLKAMAENAADSEEERRVLKKAPEDGAVRDRLNPAFYERAHAPRLIACDRDGSRAREVTAVAASLGLEGGLEVHATDFRELPTRLGPGPPLFDFAFFDCGGPPEYVAFLRDFWRLIEARYGHLVLDFTYWTRRVPLRDGTVRTMVLPGSILNEIKRQQLRGGRHTRFEVLSLLEPHKLGQGSLTVIRRLPSESVIRDLPLERDLEVLRASATDGEFELT